MTALLDRTIGELVTERPSRARVFEGFRIDYCCGGKKPLGETCKAKGIDPQLVANMLAAIDAAGPAQERDWSTASLTELCDHIESTHHAWLKTELPRIEAMARKVADRHGEHRPELVELRDIFLHAKAELEQHMAKEERVLFPWCREIDRGATGRTPSAGSVQSPIRVMEQEHDDAGHALEQMRELTDGYTPPADACNTYRAYFAALAEFEADMHRHVHKENSILFPKAVEAEKRVAG